MDKSDMVYRKDIADRLTFHYARMTQTKARIISEYIPSSLIRCSECKHGSSDGQSWKCDLFNADMEEDDFCSKADRREE